MPHLCQILVWKTRKKRQQSKKSSHIPYSNFKTPILLGGFNPSEKYESQLVLLLFPIYGKSKKIMFQTTNQYNPRFSPYQSSKSTIFPFSPTLSQPFGPGDTRGPLWAPRLARSRAIARDGRASEPSMKIGYHWLIDQCFYIQYRKFRCIYNKHISPLDLLLAIFDVCSGEELGTLRCKKIHVNLGYPWLSDVYMDLL